MLRHPVDSSNSNLFGLSQNSLYTLTPLADLNTKPKGNKPLSSIPRRDQILSDFSLVACLTRSAKVWQLPRLVQQEHPELNSRVDACSQEMVEQLATKTAPLRAIRRDRLNSVLGILSMSGRLRKLYSKYLRCNVLCIMHVVLLGTIGFD